MAREAVIAGVYISQQGDLPERTQSELFFEVANGALADAGMTLADSDGFIGKPPEGVGLRAILPGAAIADLVGHPLRFEVETHVGAAAASAGVGLAKLAIESGAAEVVLVATSSAGKAEGVANPDRNKAIEAMAKFGSPYEWL